MLNGFRNAKLPENRRTMAMGGHTDRTYIHVISAV